MYYEMYPAFMKQHVCPGASKKSCDYRMIITGKGNINAAADRASVILGVVTEGPELKSIQQENAAKMSEILDAIKRIGIREKDIGTHSYHINMIYDYLGNKQVFKGYRVTNTVKVELQDIQKAGEVIDAAVSAGANLVESIDFTISDPSKYYSEALELAVMDAVRKAKDIEKTLDIIVDDIPVNITEETDSFIPMVKSTISAYEASTPIKPGLIDITATVKAVFTYRKI